MELFPATDEDAWSLIQEVIDDSDYYVLILAGKYGSTDSAGMGFTEKEYDYAVSVRKPIIAFLCDEMDRFPVSKTEKAAAAQKKLAAFREKVKDRHCKYWMTPEDLGGKVSRSLVQLRKKHPSPGWVPGRHAADEAMLRRIEEMRVRIAELEYETLAGGAAPPGIEDLAQGDDTFSVPANLVVDTEGTVDLITLSVSWDRLFSYAGSALIGECSESELYEKETLVFWHAVPEEISKYNTRSAIIIPYVNQDAIKIQLQALGLMTAGTKRRAVADNEVYWKLTPYGEKHLIKIRALRRDAVEERQEE